MIIPINLFISVIYFSKNWIQVTTQNNLQGQAKIAGLIPINERQQLTDGKNRNFIIYNPLFIRNVLWKKPDEMKLLRIAETQFNRKSNTWIMYSSF